MAEKKKEIEIKKTGSSKKSSDGSLAVIQTGSKQYIVSEGSIIDVEKIESENGKIDIVFDKVLLLRKGSQTQVGTPYIEKATVKGEILNQVKTPKTIVFKFKKKTGYKKKQGHRQQMTTVRIKSI